MIATVSDGKVEGMSAALRSIGARDILLLSDSVAALTAVREAARRGKGRTSVLVEVVDQLGGLINGGHSVKIGWVKSYIGVKGNEIADVMAKAGCYPTRRPVYTEGGVRA